MNKEDELYLKYLLQNYEPVKASKDQVDLWMKKYKNKLEFFEYIDTEEKFMGLKPGGCIRCINKVTQKLSNIGILIKITFNEEKQNLAVVKKPSKEKKYWNFIFERNYIFYRPPPRDYENNYKRGIIKDYINYFVPEKEKHLYTESTEFPDYGVDDLYNKYKKK